VHTVVSAHSQGAILKIRLSPRAKHDGIQRVHDGQLKVSVRAPAVDHKANLALIELLSNKLGIPASKLEIISGATSRQKALLCLGYSTKLLIEKLRELKL